MSETPLLNIRGLHSRGISACMLDLSHLSNLIPTVMVNYISMNGGAEWKQD
jgi:hypothetical protein